MTTYSTLETGFNVVTCVGDTTGAMVVASGTTGGVTFTRGMTLTSAVSATGTLTQTGATCVTGTLTQTGATCVTGTLTQTGVVSITNLVTFTSAVSITGSFTRTGAASITGATVITGIVSMDNTFAMTSSPRWAVAALVSAITVSAVAASHKVRILGPNSEVLWLLATSVAGT